VIGCLVPESGRNIEIVSEKSLTKLNGQALNWTKVMNSLRQVRYIPTLAFIALCLGFVDWLSSAEDAKLIRDLCVEKGALFAKMPFPEWQ